MPWDEILKSLKLDLSLTLPLVTLAIVIPLSIIFRKEFAELIFRCTSLEFDLKARRLKLDFAKRIQQEQKRAAAIPTEITASRAVPVPDPVNQGANQTGRDMVIEAWGAVKQVVYDACVAHKIPVTPAMGIQEAVRRLGNVASLDSDLVKLIDVAHELGQSVAGHPGLKPWPDDARAYWNLAHNAAHWIGVSVLTPKIDEVDPPPPRRATVVGGNFVQPSQESPAATLIGVGGPVKGQRFSIDKPYYRMGRNAKIDLRVSGDDSISGDHAYLRFEKGGLFLFDQGSRNGTFLNEQRVTGAPLMVRHGDRIRLGESLFEVTGAPANRRPGEDRDETRKDPASRSIVR
ncbi:MAG: FHA domain-containing protein [Candidatus Binatia bacterium]